MSGLVDSAYKDDVIIVFEVFLINDIAGAIKVESFVDLLILLASFLDQ